MGVRITTWNVNGIRNPFGYQPWRDRRTFEAMFDVLEADIVIMQELKIQRKDLRDDMVLVPGWDCYFSLPKHKKGYSGVGIYTRQSTCAPIRAEEGILGVLTPPNSSTPYCDLPADKHIGGYLTQSQLDVLNLDTAELDSEGRCVVVEFPAFVLFGLYSPANSSGLRDDFRYGFLNALDMRVRSLVAHGKRVIVTGDLNVSRDEVDTAGAFEQMRKEGISHVQYMSTPNRRIFNQLLEGGEVHGVRDEGREIAVMWDICRGFHSDRTGMFTHWEQKINARPGNFGSRIDFVLCSLDMKSWFCESNIQEGLMGSDHCPVYAVIKDEVDVEGTDVHILDLMNSAGTFKNGIRLKAYSTKEIPAFSGKLLPEFDKRRSIKDMFSMKAALNNSPNSPIDGAAFSAPEARPIPPSVHESESAGGVAKSTEVAGSRSSSTASQSQTPSPSLKRKASERSTGPSIKRSKSPIKGANGKPVDKSQQSLKGFFTRKDVSVSTNGLSSYLVDQSPRRDDADGDSAAHKVRVVAEDKQAEKLTHSQQNSSKPISTSPSPSKFVDPIVSKESWTKMFQRPVAPRCEHGEPCKTMKTKKPGFNCGREFWMCQRPLGPSGGKEHGTQWRCSAFTWTSDWNGSNAEQTP